MLTEKAFARDEVYPSWFVNALGHFLSLGAFGFTLTKQDATHIEVTAGADDLAAAIAISGRWRWNEATATRAHPGGAAGTYDIYVTAADNDIVAVPAPYTDTTDYNFGLAIVAAGATPAIVPGTVDIYRHVGSLQWDGAQITRVDQTVPAVHNHAFTHHTGQPDALAPADIGAVATAGAGSLASLELTGAGTALTVDHDAAVDGVLAVAGNQTIGGTLVLTGNATLNGTLLVAGASTLEGLITGQAGLTLDAGAGSVGQTLTLTGRQAGAANPASVAVATTGGLTYNVPGGQSHAFNVAGAAVATISAAALQIPTQLQLPLAGAGGGLLIGGDATLYRNAAGSLRTSGALVVDGASTLTGAVAAGGALTVAGNVGFYGHAAAAQLAAPTQAAVNAATNVTAGTAPAALSASSTLGDTIAWVSRIANALQGMGLLGSGGVWVA